MAGRAYTMKEMRGIVDYIKERKAFSETKARKMWMDYASSELTNRTWQSLKETFLKRILPDIHNPYYKLSQYELRSFREGREVRPSQNKLEFRAASLESDTVVQIHAEEPSTSHGNQNGHETGEDVTSSKIDPNRASVDTIILTEDNSDEVVAVTQRTKSLRDCITYTEPLTPMMQEILHDFSSDDEPQLTIDEGKADETPEDIEKVLIEPEAPAEVDTYDSHPQNDDAGTKPTKKRSLRLKSSDKGNDVIVSDSSDNQKSQKKTRVTRRSKTDANTIEEVAEVTPIKTLSSNSITDSLIPNNQEGLNGRKANKDASLEASVEPAKEKATVKSLKAKKKRRVESAESDSAKEVTSSNDMAKEPPKKTQKIDKESNEVQNASSKKTQDAETKDSTKDVDKEIEGKKPENNEEGDKDVQELIPSQPSSNPCLQSVSLYEELIALDDSDKEDNPETNNKPSENKVKEVENKEKAVENKVIEVENVSKALEKRSKRPVATIKNKELVVSKKKDTAIRSASLELEDIVNSEPIALKSESDSESECFNSHDVVKPKQLPNNPTRVTKLRSKVLKSLFEGVSRKHSRHDHRKRAKNVLYLSSESSSWTSDSEQQYVSPPRSRGRHSRKYLKPNSGRILALEQEGGLFVACGKKVYPLVKDGRLIKNYLNFDPDSDVEEDVYWQKKYLEEKKKTAELSRLLERVKDQNQRRQSTFQSNSPILPSKPVKIDKSIPIHDVTSDEELHHVSAIVPKQIEQPKEEKTVKIKFAKNNEEVFLEGHWQNIHHILGEVMQMFHSDKAPAADPAPAAVLIEEADEEVHKKIDQLEEQIFKEIEDKDKSAEEDAVLPNVSERKRSGRLSKNVSPAQSKRQRIEENDRSDSEIIVNESKLKPVDNVKETGRRKGPRSLAIEPPKKNSPKKPRKATPKTSENEDETLYKFPSPGPLQRASPQPRVLRASRGKKVFDLASKKPSIVITRNSPESTQGYQDSDDSPSYNLRRKRKSISYVVQGKNRYSRNMRKKVYEFDASDESSNPPCVPINITSRNVTTRSAPKNISIQNVTMRSVPKNNTIQNVTMRSEPKNITIQNVTVNTEVYRTESYQLLMPTKASFTILDNLQEISPCPNEIDPICGNNSLDLSPASQSLSADKSESSITIHVQIEKNSSNVSLPAHNSSSVSLPLSPELSIVENITINKDALNTVEYPTINETQAEMLESLEKYLMFQVDASVPLMEQDCAVRKECNSVIPMDISEGKTMAPLMDTLMENKEIVGEYQTISETLDERMRELLLESAKKVKETKKKEAKKPKKLQAEKVATGPKKRRSSTPRKKEDLLKSRPPSVEAVIEEQMEFCSGRKSCPPVIYTISPAGNKENDRITKIQKEQKKKKKQKEIIKVKILKPKPKKSEAKVSKKRGSKSVHTDSGINDTTLSILDFNRTIDLIHNHSEACLQNECYDESVVFLDKSKSVISVNSSFNMDGSEGLPPETFSSDARDGSGVGGQNTNTLAPSSGDMEYHTPPASLTSPNSLLTEDLSDEIPMFRPDWYLFSDEDEVTTGDPLACTVSPTQRTELRRSVGSESYLSQGIDKSGISSKGTDLSHLFSNTSQKATSGSNLKHLFPVTCTVPDLSTITELSRETDANTRDLSDINALESALDEFVSCSQ